jgi:hypothetical protein
VPLDLLFRIASTIALAGWVILALAPLQRPLAVLAARVLRSAITPSSELKFAPGAPGP